MPKSDSTKKHAKKLARQKRLADRQRRVATLERKHEFPAFVYETNSTPSEFVEAVVQAVSTINFRDRDVFDTWEANYYRRVKEIGATSAIDEFDIQSEHLPAEQKLQADSRLLYNLGETVLSRIPRETLMRFIPFHDVSFFTCDYDVVAYFNSLKQAKAPGGTIYYSKHEPKIRVGEQDLTVGFSSHAIERVCERMGQNWPSYASLGDLFALFHQCLEFEPCTLYPDTQGFTFYDYCHPDYWHIGLAKEILGDSFDHNQQYSFRVGYCPAVIECGFFKAKTLLFPGFAATPEFSIMKATTMQRQDRRLMVRELKELNAKRLLDPTRLQLLKLFHEKGVPQVIPRKVCYANQADGFTENLRPNRPVTFLGD